MEKKFKVLINVHDNVEVDVERLRKHIMCDIDNPIDLDDYVNYWNNLYEAKYNNICERLKYFYVKEENAYLKYYFSPYNWNMVVEIGRTI